MAAVAPQIEALNELLAGQFCDGALLGGAKLSQLPALASGEALVMLNETL